MRPMAEAASAAALVHGPSHESSLPRRPPYHWLRPPRESVVNALLPWRVRAAADSVRPGSRTRRAAPIDDRARPFRAQAKVVRDGPPDGSGSHPKIDHIQARTLPAPPGGLPECGESTAVREQRAGTGEPRPCLGSRGRRFGSDLLWQTGRNHSARSTGRGPGVARPRRCGSDRIGCSRPRAAMPCRRPSSAIEPAARALTPSCVPS